MFFCWGRGGESGFWWLGSPGNPMSQAQATFRGYVFRARYFAKARAVWAPSWFGASRGWGFGALGWGIWGVGVLGIVRNR